MSYVLATFNAAVPITSLEKSNVSVSHPLATVVLVSVSHDIVGFVASSTFKRIGVIAVGDQTLTVICVAVAVNGIELANPEGVEIVVPAHNCAATVLSTCITELAGFVGSTIIIEALPPKSVIV